MREAVEEHRENGIGYLYCGWPGAGRDQIARAVDGILG